jgi:pre-mRNA-splicing factor CDC5/CEF1
LDFPLPVLINFVSVSRFFKILNLYREPQKAIYSFMISLWKEAISLSSCLISRVAGYSHLLHTSYQLMTEEANKTTKTEKKLDVILGGYQQHAQVLSERMAKAVSEMQKAQLDSLV